MNLMFSNRAAAGRLLAEKLSAYAARPGLIVLTVPHGGVPVAAEVAHRWHVPLDVLEVRKFNAPEDATAPPTSAPEASTPAPAQGTPGLGLAWRNLALVSRRPTTIRRENLPFGAEKMEPFNPEFGFGAVASGDFRVLNRAAPNATVVKREVIEAVTARELKKLHRREWVHRHGRPALELRDRTIILVDDVIVTGSTMRVAVAALREAGAGAIIVATPVAAREAYMELRDRVNGFVTLCLPRVFGRIGHYYSDFESVSDAAVRRQLDYAWRENIAVTSGVGVP
jgi:predicted phosphoribosyltransferase